MEITRSYDRRISTVRFPILIKWHLYIESEPKLSLELNKQNWTPFQYVDIPIANNIEQYKTHILDDVDNQWLFYDSFSNSIIY